MKSSRLLISLSAFEADFSVNGTDFSKRKGGKVESGLCLPKVRSGWGPMSMNPWATRNSVGSDGRPAISLHVNLPLVQPVPL